MKIRFLLSVSLVLACFSSATAGEDPIVIIKRAIDAQGGEALLRQAVAGRAKVKTGVLDPQNPNVIVPLRAVFDFQMPHQFKLSFSFSVDGGPEESSTYVLNAKQAWIKPADDYKKREEWAILDFRRQCYSEFARVLVPLLEDKDVNLAFVGEAKKNGRLVKEVKVTAREKPEVRLYLDRTTGLLWGLEFISLDTATGKEMKFQRYFDDYRSVYSQTADVEALKSAGVENKPAALKRFLQQHLVTREEQKKIRELIRNFGNASFEVREKARDDLVAKGSKAIGLLKEALKEADPETVNRAKECLDKIGDAKDAHQIPAAIRLLGFSKSPEALDVLLDLAPAVVEEGLLAELAGAVAVQGVHEGKPDLRIEKALQDQDPRCRAVAAAVLKREPKDAKIRTKMRLFLPGLKWPMKETLFHGADKWADSETTEILFYSGLSDDLFAKP